MASRIPAIDRSFVLVQSGSISDARAYYRLLNTLGTWLPVVALALFAGGVFLARDRRRALLRGALGFVAGMIVLGLGLAIGRAFYLSAVPPDLLPREAAETIFDTVRFLRSGLRAVAVLGLVVALAAFVTGPSSAAVRTRGFFEHGIGSMRGGAEAAGLNTGRVGSWIYAHKRALRIAVLIAAGVVLVFWTRPTAAVVLVIALLCLPVLLSSSSSAALPCPGHQDPERRRRWPRQASRAKPLRRGTSPTVRDPPRRVIPRRSHRPTNEVSTPTAPHAHDTRRPSWQPAPLPAEAPVRERRAPGRSV